MTENSSGKSQLQITLAKSLNNCDMYHSPSNEGGDFCVVCGDEWKTRPPTSYKNLGSKSTPMILGMRLLKNKPEIKLMFCDLHFCNANKLGVTA